MVRVSSIKFRLCQAYQAVVSGRNAVVRLFWSLVACRNTDFNLNNAISRYF